MLKNIPRILQVLQIKKNKIFQYTDCMSLTPKMMLRYLKVPQRKTLSPYLKPNHAISQHCFKRGVFVDSQTMPRNSLRQLGNR